MGTEPELGGRLDQHGARQALASRASGSRIDGSVWRPARIRIRSAFWTIETSRLTVDRSAPQEAFSTVVSGPPGRPSRARRRVAVTASSSGTGASGSRRGKFR